MKTLTYLFFGSGLIITSLALISLWGFTKAERNYPPLGKFMEIDNLSIHYIDQGAGTPIVFSHGASTSLRDFTSSIIPSLADQYRVIAIDRPGYGYSDRPTEKWPDPAYQAELIYKLLQKLKIEKPVLVGHSWSGSVVLAYLLAHDQETSGGVLLAGGTHPWQGGVALTYHIAGIPLLGSIFASTIVYPAGQLLLNSAVAEVFAPEPTPENYIDKTGLVLTLRANTFKASAEDVRNLSDYLIDQSTQYSNIKSPLLLITGDADTIVPAWNHSNRLVKQITHAKKVILPGAGHALHHSQTDIVSALIHDFVREINSKEIQGDR